MFICAPTTSAVGTGGVSHCRVVWGTGTAMPASARYASMGSAFLNADSTRCVATAHASIFRVLRHGTAKERHARASQRSGEGLSPKRCATNGVLLECGAE